MLTFADVCSRMLTYAHVCPRMLTYAHVCSRVLTYADMAEDYLSQESQEAHEASNKKVELSLQHCRQALQVHAADKHACWRTQTCADVC
jgi:hypothetical protein